MKINSLLAGTLALVLIAGLGSPAFADVLIDGTTQGQYNFALGQSLDGTNPVVDDNAVNTFLFPNANSNPNDPVIASVPFEPVLSAAIGALGNWLNDPTNLNANWNGPQAIPSNWAVNSETAIIYEIDAGTSGLTNVQVSIGVDNGVFVWIDGVFQGGELMPGGAAAGEFMVSLPDLSPGTHFLQILREDHGGGTGFIIQVEGDECDDCIPPTEISVGGELLPIDSTALLLVVASSPTAWLSSLALVALGIGAFVFTRNPSNMRNIKVILRDYLDRI